MEYYAGLDVSLRSCAVCIVDTREKLRLNANLLVK